MTEIEIVKSPIRRGFKEVQHLYALGQRHGALIAGGYAAWMMGQNPICEAGDVDLFTKRTSFCGELAVGLGQEGYRLYSEGVNACTYVDETGSGRKDVQIVNANFEGEFSTPEKLIKRFDMNVTQAVIVSEEFGLATSDFFVGVEERALRVFRVDNPVAAIYRIAKYIRKGYTISPLEVAKVFTAWDSFSPAKKERVIEAISQNMLDDEDEFARDEEFWEAPY